MAHLIIVRGLPGSGKSTYSRELSQRQNFSHYEADMYFERDGQYNFQPNKIRYAHKWCQESTFNDLNNDKNVIVSNTFCQYWEVKPYVEFCRKHGHTFSFVVCESEYESIHDVPSDTVNKMRERWENF